MVPGMVTFKQDSVCVCVSWWSNRGYLQWQKAEDWVATWSMKRNTWAVPNQRQRFSGVRGHSLRAANGSDSSRQVCMSQGGAARQPGLEGAAHFKDGSFTLYLWKHPSRHTLACLAKLNESKSR